MAGVGTSVPPENPQSPTPRSSTRITTTFGGLASIRPASPTCEPSAVNAQPAASNAATPGLFATPRITLSNAASIDSSIEKDFPADFFFYHTWRGEFLS